ncbi:unnamed protein product [Paramecium pentaurelia]|uniref:G domain-containing protein n=1 Tax=Paramecium pentaurelia TaxID=43138 RepID=A0A8S1YCJ7_9CILI|nr:unnamed protein product [Paramecium pentaurelia]
MIRAQRQIVLTGYIGSGKTSIFNLICKTKQPALFGGCNSQTRQPFLKEAAYGSGFRVLDTPGYGLISEKLIHAVGVLNALSEGPVNQIFLVVKWERIELMQVYLKYMVVKFLRFKHLITVAVTHWDMADKETIKQNEEQVRKMIASYKLNSVIFLSKLDSGENVCAQIDTILDKSQAEKIELTEAEFYSNFDLIELKNDIEFELQDQTEEVNRNFRKIAKAIRQFIKEFDDNNPSMHEIMHYLALETKKIAEGLISDFEIKNNDKFSELFEYHSNPSLAYLIHFELKKALMIDIDEIVKLTQYKMKNNQEHFFNFIKACPFCGLIWLKVYGSCTTTTCGNFPTTDDSKFSKYKLTQKYTFNITEKGVTYTLNQENLLQSNPTTSKTYVDPSLKEKQKKLGCGKPIIWKEIPALSPQQLKELIDPGLMDYFANEVPNEELKKILMKAQKSIKDKVDQIKIENTVVKL